MARFPYTDFQIEEIVQTRKHPRDWEPVVFSAVPKNKNSRKTNVQLVREDGRSDRVRIVIQGSLIGPSRIELLFSWRMFESAGSIITELSVAGFTGRSFPKAGIRTSSTQISTRPTGKTIIGASHWRTSTLLS